MEIGRSLGQLLKRGWRPERTIVLAGWDGEEYGLLGSTEWGEQFAPRHRAQRRRLHQHGRRRRTRVQRRRRPVARQDDRRRHQDRPGSGRRLDLRRVDGRRARRRPSIAWAAARTTRCSSTTSARRRWRSATRRPAASTTRPTTTRYQIESFLDPGYLGHQAASRTSGVTALRLANADALPLRYSDYARAGGRLRRRAAGDPATPTRRPLRSTWRRCATRPQAWGAASTALEARAAELVERRLAAARAAAAGSTGR